MRSHSEPRLPCHHVEGEPHGLVAMDYCSDGFLWVGVIKPVFHERKGC